jgi:predicted amidophosphoribosyltransferase
MAIGPWEITVLIVVFFIVIIISRYQTKRICPRCGFAIRSYTSQCPECGLVFPKKKKLQERP